MKNVLLPAILLLLFSCQNNQPVPNNDNPVLREESTIVKRQKLNPYVAVDVSPIDIAYFPTDYPIQKMEGKADALPLARVIYSRPHRQGRQIFGSIVKWNEPWRLGANEATEIELFAPATVQNKRLEKGRYILYAIPHEDRWTIVFNTNLYTWGLKFDAANDVAKVDIPATTKNQMVEHLSMKFEKSATGADLVIAWENVEARLPFQF